MRQVKDEKVALPHAALADADWADCYSVIVDQPFPTARDAAEAIVAAFPKWTSPALALRQVLVTPFGLKGSDRSSSGNGKVGIFPIILEDERALVAGMDDSHLDFRIVVEIIEMNGRQRVSLATLIKRHNLIGRIYLPSVLPFHRAIIRAALGGL